MTELTYEAIFMRRKTLVRQRGLSGEEAEKIFRNVRRRKGNCLIIREYGTDRARLLMKVNAIEVPPR